MAAPGPDRETDVLCPRCMSMFSGQQNVLSTSDPDSNGPPPTHHPSVSSFEGAVRSGCVLCYRLLRALQKAGCGNLRLFDEEAGFSHWTLVRRRDGELSFSIFVSFPKSAPYMYRGTKRRWFTLYQSAISSEGYDGPTKRILADYGTTTASEASWDQATSWYNQCRNHHQTCNAAKGQSSFLPTRLLELSSNRKQIKLVTGEKRVCREYATLSHRWGGSDIICLRTDNLAQFQEEIDVDDLPQTFKDAVEVARKLGIFYLWIDSLCIVQDDLTDWHTESALMGEVYNNGVLNIMATACKNSHQGLYRERDPRELDHCSFKSSWTGIEEKHLTILDSDLWEMLIKQAPLNERGWVLQERTLAPRTLHFAENQLAWECHTMEACEMYPDGLPGVLENLSSRVKLIDPDAYRQWLSTWRKYDPTRHVAYDVWARIVRLYSGTQLTKEADRLVAISGLAKRMRSILNDEYLAGLWARHLPYQLVWYIPSIRNVGGKGDRVENYRAPSWSWASMEGEVIMPMIARATKAESLIEIEEAKITPLSSIDDTAEVIDGHIRLKGHLFKADVLDRDADARRRLRFRVDNKVIGGRIQMEERIKHTSVFILPIYRESGRLGQSLIYSLILNPAEGRPKGWYSRIGVMTTWSGERDDEAWTYISEQLEDRTLRDKSLGLEVSFGTIILI
ncbi:unnamed protein product [Clonostachys solani]|uniref:Heterokaryon incompatibility domain-containing protein n=1 Tax=Clonostachys solani TaxID=160281 RepID=A0A9P0EPI8_9HYPO|nr:unnamed protein product [Clonostachys solani]